MQVHPAPTEETLKALRVPDFAHHHALPDEVYSRTARLAAVLLNARCAVVSLIGEGRTWRKAHAGFTQPEQDDHLAFCTQTLAQDGVLVVEDVCKEPSFNDTAASSQPGYRFYAGVALRTRHGKTIGTLCVLDDLPRQIQADQKQALSDLAAILMDELEAKVMKSGEDFSKNAFLNALDCFPSGFAVYDNRDRLIACNEQYWELFPEIHTSIKTGVRFEHLLGRAVEEGLFPDALGNEEEWIAGFLASNRGSGQRHSHLLRSGKWVGFQEQPTEGGGLVGFSYDLTEIVLKELELSRLAWTDGLTGCLNRHRLFELANVEIDRVRRNRADACMLMLDADLFKRINDRHGHGAGDAVLKGLAQRWRDLLRPDDLLGRIGGEEFCVVMPELDIQAGEMVAERLRKAIADLPFAHDGQLLRVTVSIGLSVLSDGDDLDSWMQRADLALYEAKNSGRDRFVVKAA